MRSACHGCSNYTPEKRCSCREATNAMSSQPAAPIPGCARARPANVMVGKQACRVSNCSQPFLRGLSCTHMCQCLRAHRTTPKHTHTSTHANTAHQNGILTLRRHIGDAFQSRSSILCESSGWSWEHGLHACDRASESCAQLPRRLASSQGWDMELLTLAPTMEAVPREPRRAR
jgi:hypothetical protein